MDPLMIDKKSTALVVIDLQKGIAYRETAPYSSETVIANSAKLVNACRKNSMPVFLVHVVATEVDRLHVVADESMRMPGQMPKDWSDFVPEMSPQPGDIIIGKKQWGAFYGTELDLQLRRRSIKTIILCGIATNFGVESTARFAYEFGYNQIFAEDAMASMTSQMHESSVNFVLRRIGLVRKTSEILQHLQG